MGVVLLLFVFVRSIFRNQADLAAENFALRQQLAVLKPHARVSLNGRIAFFGNRNGRVSFYEYERDLPGMFSSRQLRGDGARAYFLARIDLGSGMSWSARYAVTRFRDRDVVGSGRDTIEGNTRSRISMQLDVDFR